MLHAGMVPSPMRRGWSAALRVAPSICVGSLRYHAPSRQLHYNAHKNEGNKSHTSIHSFNSNGASSSSSSSSSSSLSSPRAVRVCVAASDGGMRFDRWIRSKLKHHTTTRGRGEKDTAKGMGSGGGGGVITQVQIDRLLKKRSIRRAPSASASASDADQSGAANLTNTSRPKLTASYRVQPDEEFLVPSWLFDTPVDASSTSSSPSSSSSFVSSDPRCRVSSSQRADLIERILYEDSNLCIINKPRGLAVHRGTGQEEMYLSGMTWALEGRRNHVNQTNSTTTSTTMTPIQPDAFDSSYRLVHRLDKETSGCIMLAKNRSTAKLLSDLLKHDAEKEDDKQHHTSSSSSTMGTITHGIIQSNLSKDAIIQPATNTGPSMMPHVQKSYLALVHGRPLQSKGSLISPAPNGSICHSSYEVLWSTMISEPSSSSSTGGGGIGGSRFTCLRLIPHTGRKRQLRSQCHFELGCTIVGEQLNRLDETITPESSQQRQLEQRERILRQRLSESVNGATNGGITPSSARLPLFLHADSLSVYHPSLNGGMAIQVHAPHPTPFVSEVEKIGHKVER